MRVFSWHCTSVLTPRPETQWRDNRNCPRSVGRHGSCSTCEEPNKAPSNPSDLAGISGLDLLRLLFNESRLSAQLPRCVGLGKKPKCRRGEAPALTDPYWGSAPSNLAEQDNASFSAAAMHPSSINIPFLPWANSVIHIRSFAYPADLPRTTTSFLGIACYLLAHPYSKLHISRRPAINHYIFLGILCYLLASLSCAGKLLWR